VRAAACANRELWRVVPLTAALFLLCTFSGCATAPPATRTGFLGSYANLRAAGEHRMSYASPDLGTYSAFIVDPVQMRAERGELSPEERAEVARYFHASLVTVLRGRGYEVSETVGTNTARVRIALTNVQESTWWMKLHPASGLSGAGRGGAAMEGEIIDAVTGEQLAAVVQSGSGSQFTLGHFSTVADIKNLIDQWSKQAGDRLDELRATSR
jgi:hypothetical protein